MAAISWRSGPGLVCFLFLAFTFIASGSEAQCIRNTTYPLRLPTTFIPNYYFMSLTPNFVSQTFYGVMTINVTTTAASNCLILHAKGLQLSTVTENITKSSSSGFSYEPENEWVVINFPSTFQPNRQLIFTVPFSGSINAASAEGFFSSSTNLVFGPILSAAERRVVYNKPPLDHFEELNRPIIESQLKEKRKPQQGQKLMYATQFEPTYARMAFPCFDEPAFKAIWQAEFTIPSNQNLTVLFNSMENGVNYNRVDNTEVWSFKPMPHPMANYLVAYAIGEFEYKEQISDGTRFRIYTPIGGKQYVDFSLQNTINVLKYFGSIWDFPFQLEKLDQIAVPAIQSDAMENWGLCTYDPSFLLIDPKNNDLSELELVASVVVHELSHQWFGDTITLPWWSETYLNEGFARYLQYVGVDYLYPQWYINTLAIPMLNFYGFVYNPAITADTTGTSGPTISDQSYISGNASSAKFSFGFMSYSKGGCLNKMFANYLGDDQWNKGLALQINTHKWTNPTYIDLLNSIETATGQQITDKFTSWLTQPGFPLVTVNYHPHIDPNTIIISQEPVTTYYISPKSVWWLHAQVSILNMQFGSELISNLDTFSTNTTIKLPNHLGMADCFHLNSNYTGYFLTRYASPRLAQAFVVKATSRSTPQVQRYQMISELFQVVHLYPEDYNTIMDLTANMIRHSRDSQSWNLMLTNWIQFEQINKLNGAEQLATILLPLRLEVGWRHTGEVSFDTIRPNLLLASAFFGAVDVITTAAQLYAEHAVSRKPVPADIRSAVYFSVVRYGSSEGYGAVMYEYQKLPTNDTTNRLLLLSMLAVSPNPGNCQSILGLQREDPSIIFAASLSMVQFNFECRDIAFNYILANAAKFPGSSGSVTKAFKLLADPVHISQVQQFFQQNPDFTNVPTQTDTLAWMQINQNLASAGWF